MQTIDRPTRIQLSVKQENQDALDLADEYAANLHVSRSQVFFWALLALGLYIIANAL